MPTTPKHFRNDARAVAQWRAVAAKVEQFNGLFALLAFDKRVKRIFGGELDKPKFEYDEGRGGRAWLGVYASKGVVWYYAGIGALQGGEAVMLVDVAVSGDSDNSMTSSPPVARFSISKISDHVTWRSEPAGGSANGVTVTMRGSRDGIFFFAALR